MKRDKTERQHFHHVSTGVLGPLPQPAGGPRVETSLEIPWRQLWEQAHRRSLWWRYLVPLAALVAICGHLYRGLSPRVAAVALLLFAADEAHAYTSGWISNGHTVVSVVPALLGTLSS